jgi:hypothetical protein
MEDPQTGGCISRREALRWAIIAGGAMVLRNPRLEGAPAGDQKFTFALVSDTHLGRGGEGPSRQMRAAVEEINASGAEFAIFPGDLVNAGQEEKNEIWYPQWKELAGSLAIPWYALPGNHDPDELFHKHIAADTDFVIDRPPFRFICFRDAKRNPAHDGIVTAEQCQWLARKIDEAAAAKLRAILVSHIIYHENHHPERGWKIETGREEFGKLLAEKAGKVCAFFAGHFHNGLRGWDDTSGIHEVVLPSNCWNDNPWIRPTTANPAAAPAPQAITPATGWALDEFRAGYVLVEASATELVLRYKPLEHQIVVQKDLPLSKI